MPSLKSILSLSLSLLSLLQYHTNALALPTNEHDTTTISKREMNITLICPSTRAPVFGSVSGAWKILEHLKTLDNEPPLPTVAMEDGCRRMGCQEGTGVFWCVRDAKWAYHNPPTYKTLVEQAQMILDNQQCKSTDVTNTRPMVAGEAVYGDAWSVVLKGLDCKAGQE
ncbi:hypothetical protein B0T09DRAFT_352437 [Sordaria sp. MPI-SDFR-AT-0083]|nr:hypothetical protein B0T09DRAFT_352437 [Sordaria sp. MPI-SDFR-AT-0083]